MWSKRMTDICMDQKSVIRTDTITSTDSHLDLPPLILVTSEPLDARGSRLKWGSSRYPYKLGTLVLRRDEELR